VVAYNVWQHYAITGSIQCLRFQGAELLIEIARLWASAASYNRRLDQYDILGVVGPTSTTTPIPAVMRLA
jgi:trehalose/maltose hydrolase-like predicted phosphorylase